MNRIDRRFPWPERPSTRLFYTVSYATLNSSYNISTYKPFRLTSGLTRQDIGGESPHSLQSVHYQSNSLMLQQHLLNSRSTTAHLIFTATYIICTHQNLMELSIRHTGCQTFSDQTQPPTTSLGPCRSSGATLPRPNQKQQEHSIFCLLHTHAMPRNVCEQSNTSKERLAAEDSTISHKNQTG